MIVPAFLVVVGLGGASGAVSTNAALSRWLKMAASSLVVVVALVAADEATAYLALVIGALCSSWIGDLSLSFDSRRAFVIGLLSFAAIRTQNLRRETLCETIADYVFLAALIGLLGVILLIARSIL